MQIRNAARVFPEPVGAEISVVLPERISGQPCSCGSVGVPKRPTNHSRTSGCAQSSELETGTSLEMAEGADVEDERGPTGGTGKSEAGTDIFLFYRELRSFANSSPHNKTPPAASPLE